jgi:hypothetical protein
MGSVTSVMPVTTPVSRLLNLGCGSDCHPAFVNVDIVAAPGVIVHDLRDGVPFPDGTYDLVYHSTMLSHLRAPDALSLMGECYRVLTPGGVLRVVTEDLEQMCRTYLQKLEAAWSGDIEGAREYEWMMLELYDQATREQPGGGMAQYMSGSARATDSFIYSRVGEQGRQMIAAARARASRAVPPRASRSLISKVKAQIRRGLYTTVLGARGLQALELGQFRLSSGQVSYRMYDRYSLRQLFLDAGFSSVSLQTVSESTYRLWNEVNLDLSPDGKVARPHALIMEGIRP